VLPLAYVADADGNPVEWNETRWVDEEFSTLLKEAEGTLDVEKRREIMCKLEDIQMERGSIGIAYWKAVWNIVPEKFKNMSAHPTEYDLLVNVHGGGLTGQADAIKQGAARALCDLSPDNRKPLKTEGHLSRDPRAKERRKYGLKKARKAPQFSKR